MDKNVISVEEDILREQLAASCKKLDLTCEPSVGQRVIAIGGSIAPCGHRGLVVGIPGDDSATVRFDGGLIAEVELQHLVVIDYEALVAENTVLIDKVQRVERECERIRQIAQDALLEIIGE